MKVLNPSTEETIEELKLTTKEELDGLVEKSWSAFKEWSQTPLEEREKIIKKFGEILEENKKEVSELISKETGKVITEGEG